MRVSGILAGRGEIPDKSGVLRTGQFRWMLCSFAALPLYNKKSPHRYFGVGSGYSRLVTHRVGTELSGLVLETLIALLETGRKLLVPLDASPEGGDLAGELGVTMPVPLVEILVCLSSGHVPSPF